MAQNRKNLGMAINESIVKEIFPLVISSQYLRDQRHDHGVIDRQIVCSVTQQDMEDTNNRK